MDILLNEEGIEKLSEEWLGVDENIDWGEYMCKAQLKKLVEWLEEYERATRLTSHHKFMIPRKDLAELKEMVK